MPSNESAPNANTTAQLPLTSFDWVKQKPATPILKEVREIQRKETRSEQAIRVNGAKALLVNYELIQHDFPFLRDGQLKQRFPALKKMPAKAQKAEICHIIDNWLVENSAFISTSQAEQTVVNTEISLGEEKTLAFRPPDYGRALVFSLHENAVAMGRSPTELGLLDVKGVGVAPDKKPVASGHSDGLYELDAAISEVLVQQIIERAFRHAGGVFDTLPNYGVIDFGFDIKRSRGRRVPAGVLVRRAHVRQWLAGAFPSSPLEEQYMMEIELMLRKYGITSTCPGTTYSVWEAGKKMYYVSKPHRVVAELNEAGERLVRRSFPIGKKPLVIQSTNVQLTRDLNPSPPKTSLVDFTHYGFSAEFRHPVYVAKDGKPLFLGETIAYPGDRDYVQPDPSLQIPFSDSGEIGCIWGYPNFDKEPKLGSICNNLVKEYRAGILTRAALAQKLSAYFNHLTQQLVNS